MTATVNHPDLIPLDLPAGRHALVSIPANDQWLLSAGIAVSRHPKRDRRVAVLPFWIDRVELGGARWNVRGVGELALSADGSLSDMHVVGKQQARIARGPHGHVCYVATWIEDRPVLIRVWDMRLDRGDTESWVHVWWRPEFDQLGQPRRKPRFDLRDFGAIPPKERRLLERDIENFLEGKAKQGPKTASENLKLQWLADIRGAIDEIFDGTPNDVANWAVAVAQRRGIGERTVHERLGKNGTSIREEVEAGRTRWQRKRRRAAG